MVWTFGLRSAPGHVNCALPAQVFATAAVHTESGAREAPRRAVKAGMRTGTGMGELIRLAERRQARRERAQQRPASLRAEFLFDLVCPFTYLAAERVERAFDDVTWTPASATALRRGSLAGDEAEIGRAHV